MLKGYVAHKLSKLLKLHRGEQNVRPIEIREVFSQATFDDFNQHDVSQHPTTTQTLNFSTLRLPAYQAVLQLPPNIYDILSAMNEERNKLHLLASIDFQFGKSVISDIKQLIDFVMMPMRRKITALNEELFRNKPMIPTDRNGTFRL